MVDIKRFLFHLIFSSTGTLIVFGSSLKSSDSLIYSNLFQRKVAFDELFEKFCGAGGSNQFAYFDECWSKLARDKGKTSVALADAEGALAEV